MWQTPNDTNQSHKVYWVMINVICPFCNVGDRTLLPRQPRNDSSRKELIIKLLIISIHSIFLIKYCVVCNSTSKVKIKVFKVKLFCVSYYCRYKTEKKQWKYVLRQEKEYDEIMEIHIKWVTISLCLVSCTRHDSAQFKWNILKRDVTVSMFSFFK